MSTAGPEHPVGAVLDRYAVPRRWALGLAGLTTLGALAGVQGFLSGAFDPLVEQLSGAVEMLDGSVLPALALGVCVGLPQAATLALGLRRHRWAGHVALGAGTLLAGWVLVQLPLIGWTSPVQWVFFAIALGEIAASLLWLRRVGAR